VLSADAPDKTVTWSSSNETVATVAAGKVTAVGVGTATITATSVVDDRRKGTCALTVVIPASTVENMNMVWINSGTFTLGSGPVPEPGRSTVGAENLRPVTLTKGFYMGATEVTQAQYEALMGSAANGSTYPKAGDPNADRKGEFPVEHINWHEALRFCNLLSIKEGLNPVYTIYKASAPNADGLTVMPFQGINNWEDIPENWSTDPADWGPVPVSGDIANGRWSFARMVTGTDGYRLPTEAEWEYACRAGTWGDNYSIFNTGKNTIRIADANYSGGNYNNSGAAETGLGQPVPVGMYEPNAWGLYDMHGNVAEWVWGRHTTQAYPAAGVLQTDPIYGYYSHSTKRIRGGKFDDGAGYLRSASCDAVAPFLQDYEKPGDVGLRVVRYIDQSGE
jgi:formylglycine-generating enzyme required for sulfatase activity